jgi:phosphoglycolate phosphatase
VSNNSKTAVAIYLSIHDLAEVVHAISARETADVALLKPNPHLVTNAAKMSDAHPSACTLIGDSPTDIEAAHAAGARAIGYANTPDKVERFPALGPASIVTKLPILGIDPVTN